MSRRPVETEHLAAGFPGDGVGFQPLPVVPVYHENLFVGENPRFRQQFRINFQTAFIIEHASRQTGVVNLAAQHNFLHNDQQTPLLNFYKCTINIQVFLFF